MSANLLDLDVPAGSSYVHIEREPELEEIMSRVEAIHAGSSVEDVLALIVELLNLDIPAGRRYVQIQRVEPELQDIRSKVDAIQTGSIVEDRSGPRILDIQRTGNRLAKETKSI